MATFKLLLTLVSFSNLRSNHTSKATPGFESPLRRHKRDLEDLTNHVNITSVDLQENSGLVFCFSFSQVCIHVKIVLPSKSNCNLTAT